MDIQFYDICKIILKTSRLYGRAVINDRSWRRGVKIDYSYENFAIASICLQKIFFQILSLNGVFDLSKNVHTQELIILSQLLTNDLQ